MSKTFDENSGNEIGMYVPKCKLQCCTYIHTPARLQQFYFDGLNEKGIPYFTFCPIRLNAGLISSPCAFKFMEIWTHQAWFDSFHPVQEHAHASWHLHWHAAVACGALATCPTKNAILSPSGKKYLINAITPFSWNLANHCDLYDIF